MFKFNSFRFQRQEKVSTVWLHCEVQVCDGERIVCQPVSVLLFYLFTQHSFTLLTCHSRKSPDVTNNINNDVLLVHWSVKCITQKLNSAIAEFSDAYKCLGTLAFSLLEPIIREKWFSPRLLQNTLYMHSHSCRLIQLTVNWLSSIKQFIKPSGLAKLS